RDLLPAVVGEKGGASVLLRPVVVDGPAVVHHRRGVGGHHGGVLAEGGHGPAGGHGEQAPLRHPPLDGVHIPPAHGRDLPAGAEGLLGVQQGVVKIAGQQYPVKSSHRSLSSRARRRRAALYVFHAPLYTIFSQSAMAGRGRTADKSRIGWDKQAARGGGKGAMEPMTIKRRPRPSPRRRQIAALLVSAGVLWTGAVTAASPTAQAALQALGRQGDVALAILRHQLADGRELDAVPASVALAIGQSPLLLGGREAVGELRGQDETDTDEG